MKKTSAILASTMATVALGFASSPAHALEPTRSTTLSVSTMSRTCPSGQVLLSRWEVTRDFTTFYDDAGTAIRQEIHAVGIGTTTNTTTGVTVPNTFVRIFHKDLITGEFFTTGRNATFHFPGGESVPGAGHLEFDARGNLIDHDGPDSASELAQGCAALAP